ncbi:unnamed protein product [Clavelina lepadiformis]|uniref:Ribosomal protein S13 n=1 Tax=Clavelina lepadiformis TaxID=159417 RepID=A0ABP0FMI1_CLALP
MGGLRNAKYPAGSGPALLKIDWTILPGINDRTNNNRINQTNRIDQIGHQLSKVYNLRINNDMHHVTAPSRFYQHALKLRNKHQATLKELCTGKIKTTNRRLRKDKRDGGQIDPERTKL